MNGIDTLARTGGTPRAARRWSAVAFAAMTALAGCGGGDDAKDGGNYTVDPPVAPSEVAVLKGQVVKGPVAGATVTLQALAADGSLGTTLGSATTAADGTFRLGVTALPSGPVALVARGGSYVSEADGSTVTEGSGFTLLLSGVTAGELAGLVLSPVSDMVSARTRAMLAAGTPLADGLAAARTLIGTTYGLDPAALQTLAPRFDKAGLGTAAYTLGVLLGAFDTCDRALPSALRGKLYGAISQDIADGVFDGKAGSASIRLADGSALASTAGTSDFLGCVARYAAGGKAVVDAGVAAADVATTVGAIRTAVTQSPATPRSAGLSTGSSGAISSLAWGGRQWLFLAARANGVVAIDITDPEATTRTTKVWSALVANHFGGLEIGGVVPLLGADHPQLLVYAYGSKHNALVDADTGAVEYEADLPLTSAAPVYFSGGSAYIAGAIPDTARDGVWLATADGYVFFDRATRKLGAPITIAYPASLAENIGGDIGRGMLFAANYAPGVQIVDLATTSSYYFDGTPFRTAFPSMFEPDGGAVDTNLRVGIVTDEDSGQIGLLDLTKLTMTSVAGGRSTFAPAAGAAVPIDLGRVTISGAAVDSDTHLVLFMAGYSNDIAVGKLQDPAAAPATGWAGLVDWRNVVGLTGYDYARDPHAVAVVKNLAGGRSYGYLLDGDGRGAFQVDMAALLAAPADASRNVTTDPTTNGIVRRFGW